MSCRDTILIHKRIARAPQTRLCNEWRTKKQTNEKIHFRCISTSNARKNPSKNIFIGKCVPLTTSGKRLNLSLAKWVQAYNGDMWAHLMRIVCVNDAGRPAQSSGGRLEKGSIHRIDTPLGRWPRLAMPVNAINSIRTHRDKTIGTKNWYSPFWITAAAGHWPFDVTCDYLFSTRKWKERRKNETEIVSVTSLLAAHRRTWKISIKLCFFLRKTKLSRLVEVTARVSVFLCGTDDGEPSNNKESH